MLKPDKRRKKKLSDFYEKVREIAEEYGETYFTVKVEFNSQHGTEYGAYINNFNWEDGKSIEEVLEKLRTYHDGPVYVKDDLVLDQDED